MANLLYTDEYIDVTYIETDEISTVFAGYGAEVGLEIKNNSDENLRVSAVGIMVDGVAIEKSELLESFLMPGKKKQTGVHFYYKAFPAGNVKSLADVKNVTFSIKYEIGDTGVKKINGPVNIEL